MINFKKELETRSTVSFKKFIRNEAKEEFVAEFPDFHDLLSIRDGSEKSRKKENALFYHLRSMIIRGKREVNKCKNCGNNVVGIFNSAHAKIHKEREYCDYRCMVNCEEGRDFIKEKSRLGVQKKYGVDNVYQSDLIKDKIKKTNIERYGVCHPSKNCDIKEKIKKTNIERYGVEHPAQSEEVKEKTKETNLSRYGNACSLNGKESIIKKKRTWNKNHGVDHPMKSPIVVEKLKDSNMKTHGVGCTFQLDSVKEKIKETSLIRYDVEHPSQSDVVKRKIKATCKEKYGHENPYQVEKFKLKSYLTKKERYGGNISITESALENDYKKYIEMLGFKTEKIRLADNKEIDIFIPELKIGFEINGEYWHSLYSPSYHKNKTEQALSEGIDLYHIWENDDFEETKVKIYDVLFSIFKVPNSLKISRDWLPNIKDNIYLRNGYIVEEVLDPVKVLKKRFSCYDSGTVKLRKF